MFDPSAPTIQERFQGSLELDGKDWNIGVIYGASGTGKSTIARELFKAEFIDTQSYSAPSILDDMPQGLDTKTITQIFNAVGFSSPPSWLKPYAVLSNGEKMRVDLARALMENREMVVFDEFTSVVDREVAKIGSFAVQKAVRRMKKKFIAVSCHDDILPWLEPDWTYCTNDHSFFLRENISGQKSNLRYTVAERNYGKRSGVITI